MVDLRIQKLANILVNYSIAVKKGSIIEISCGPEARDLALECYKLILKKGAFPRINAGLPGTSYIYYKHASETQLMEFPKLAMYEAKNIDGYISIGTEYNTRELNNIDPKRVAMRQKVTRPISDVILKKNNWVICEYPTNALAQDADMSLEEFENFVYSACNQDWKNISKKMDKLKAVLDKGKDVHIISDDTDLKFSIKNMIAIKGDGSRNMPDGEVFTAPVKDTAEGHIKYSFPAIKGGREVDGIYLEFKKGKVVKATAEKNEKYLLQCINMDKGARYLGELGVGTNFGIKNFIKQILFDEKIGGTVHLALGLAYKECGVKDPSKINKSALHWDMIKDLRKGGKLIVDGKVIQKNGKFMT